MFPISLRPRTQVTRGTFTVALVAFAFAACARAGYSFEAPPSHPDWEPGVEALQRLDYPMAITHLAQVVTNQPDNADAQNALGFAYASTRRYDLAIKHLREALRLDPRHLSAHENLGRAYLGTGNKAKAREHLAALQRLCSGGCEEQRSLAKALAAAR
jgi:Flp pilus assembly protein TadD